jgi:hypothetical protein
VVNLKEEYKVYASVYKVPDAGHVKANLIVVVDKEGKLIESLAGPVAIGPLVQRFTEKFAKRVVQSAVGSWFDINVRVESIQLMSYEKLGKMLFKLENK